EDVPFCASLGDAPLLGIDLMACSGVDFRFFFEPLIQDFDDRKANGIPVFYKFDLINRGQPFSNLMREDIDLFSAYPHSFTRYKTIFRSRTSLFLISLNIS